MGRSFTAAAVCMEVKKPQNPQKSAVPRFSRKIQPPVVTYERLNNVVKRNFQMPPGFFPHHNAVLKVSIRSAILCHTYPIMLKLLFKIKCDH